MNKQPCIRDPTVPVEAICIRQSAQRGKGLLQCTHAPTYKYWHMLIRCINRNHLLGGRNRMNLTLPVCGLLALEDMVTGTMGSWAPDRCIAVAGCEQNAQRRYT